MNVRPSPIAGQWYPADPERLRQSVEGMLEAAPAATLEGELVGLIVPHAGHQYSGRIAARAFRLARGLPVETVAVVSPMHQGYLYRGPVLTTAHEAYGTPFGTVPVNMDAVQAVSGGLRQSLGTGLTHVEADQEHSLEIELPFLQRALGGFQLIPLMLAEQTQAVAQPVGQALAAALQGRPALLVGSSDLSHYKPQSVAEKLDREILSRIEALDPLGVLEVAQEQARSSGRGEGSSCGHGAIASVLWAAEALGATRAQVVGYGTSGDVTGDYESVVGYGAAAIWK